VHLLATAIVVLAIIIWTSLKVSSIGKKLAIFVGLGGATWAFLSTQGEQAIHVLHHTFVVDYVQFITIPLATVFIASLNLFAIKVADKAKLGWFLWLVCPIIGNFGTTWALVPIGLSLVPVLKEHYPDTWKFILVAMCVFAMNMMALATLAADPPQALWAVKVSATGESLKFFFPLTQFWIYLLFTWGLYLVVLKRLGVTFGGLDELFKIKPKNTIKSAMGLGIAICVGYAVTELKGYEIPTFLGIVISLTLAAGFGLRKQFGHHEREETIHWGLETVSIFVAFFSVVAFAHAGLEHVTFSNEAMIGPVIGLTLGADNAAAFAAAYPQYEAIDRVYMVWYNLFNAVAYGGTSPLGNGPQITLFLIILVSLKEFKSGEVFVIWFKEAGVFFPYLAIWTLMSSIVIQYGAQFGIPFSGMIQAITGIIAFFVANQAMDLQSTFRIHVGAGKSWDGRQPSDPDSDATNDEALGAMGASTG